MNALQNAKLNILRPIIKAGYQAYIAGGSVRAHFFNEEPHDVDICTDAPEEILQNLFNQVSDVSKNMNLKVFVVKSNEFNYEIARFRCNEVYSNHRSPDSVDFNCKLKEDAARRDFTINAMFLDEEDNIIDFFGGRQDIKNKVLRAVGDPEARFTEDCLRILRAVRFAAKYDLFIEDNTRKAMNRLNKDLLTLPAERITGEIEKMMELGGREFSRALKIMRDTGILKVILPEIAVLEKFPHDNDSHPEGPEVLSHILAAVRVCKSKDPLILYSVLFHDVGKAVTYKYRYKEKSKRWRHTYYGHDKAGVAIIEEIGERLKLPAKTIDVAKYCATEHMLAFRLPEMKPSKILTRIEHPYFDYLMEVSACDYGARGDNTVSEGLQKRKDFVDRFKKTASLTKWINGNLVMEHCNVKQGKIVGRIIQLTKNFIVENNCSDKEVVLLKMQDFVKMVKKDPKYS